ncbi:c-type cytochrome [Pseudanabaenaceae cyanobacterium LEGE 13415]|nr:c-type cytochrome [Pseudanabaenaceae cyanobacterium LEGE 13415]
MILIRWTRTLLAALIVPILLGITVFSPPALAADSAAGAKVFNANCAACHMNGGNAVNAAKTLKKEALTQYGKDSIEAIVTQVTNGKGAMPSFKAKLNEDQIQSVAMYVLEKAEAGWK